jgi:hypothetical protein
MGTGEPKTFRVKPLVTYPDTMSVQWLKDGEVVSSATKATFAATFAATFDKVGTHTLWAIVQDITQAVRRDRYVLADTAKWKINPPPVRQGNTIFPHPVPLTNYFLVPLSNFFLFMFYAFRV